RSSRRPAPRLAPVARRARYLLRLEQTPADLVRTPARRWAPAWLQTELRAWRRLLVRWSVRAWASAGQPGLRQWSGAQARVRRSERGCPRERASPTAPDGAPGADVAPETLLSGERSAVSLKRQR